MYCSRAESIYPEKKDLSNSNDDNKLRKHPLKSLCRVADHELSGHQFLNRRSIMRLSREFSSREREK